MISSRWVILAAFVSFSSFGAVSFKEKQMRVESLMKLQSKIPAIAFDAYQRELGYEVQGLAVETRAKIETNLIAEKMRSQIHAVYQEALEELESLELAREQVKNAMERDLEMAAPEMKEELVEFANETLDAVQAGGSSREVELSNVQAAVKKQVVVRKNFLNEEPVQGADKFYPSINTSKDSDKKVYASRDELVASLASDKESSRWVSTSNQTIRTTRATKAETKISMQVKMEFMGVTLEAGPSISFKRTLASNANIMAEGMDSIIDNKGGFARVKYDANGKVMMKNGKPVKRYASFNCDVDYLFETEYEGAGGFKYFGMGVDSSYTKVYSNEVNIQSRRIALPEVIGNKTVTVAFISDLCQIYFPQAKITNSTTVHKSLENMMANVISSLVFSHPKTVCIKDSDCQKWYKNEVSVLQKKLSTGSCIEDKKDKFRTCEVRGIKGQNCPVMEKGILTSSGRNEYPCAKNFSCKKFEEATYLFDKLIWTYSRGSCQPNKR